MLIRVLDRAEQVGVTLIRESGEELRGVMDHGERAGGRLICRIGSETRDTIELAIDKAAGKVQLLTDNLAEKAQLLLQGAGVEARLCLDHMQKNAIMILDHIPKVAGAAAFEAADGVGAGLRHQFRWGPALPMLVTQIDRALRSGEHEPYELVELVWTQPETRYQEKYEAYFFLLRFFQVNIVNSQMTAQRRFAVQFFISFAALQDHVQQGYVEWFRGRRDPRIFTAELLRLPGQEGLRDRAVRLLENIRDLTLSQIADEVLSIMTELQPPQMLQLEAPSEDLGEDPRQICQRGLSEIDSNIRNAELVAQNYMDQPDKDDEVRDHKETIQGKIYQLEADHPALLSPALDSDATLRQDVLDRKGRCEKIEPLRSKAFLLRELEGEDMILPQESSHLPDSMPWSEYDQYKRISTPRLPFQPGRFYYIQAKHIGLVINVWNKGTSNENAITQFPNQNMDHQHFSFEDSGDGTHFYIVNRKSGKVLNVHGRGSANETAITLFPRQNLPHQMFSFHDSGDGTHFYIIAKNSGKVLNVQGRSCQREALITIYDKNTRVDCQKFCFIPV